MKWYSFILSVLLLLTIACRNQATSTAPPTDTPEQPTQREKPEEEAPEPAAPVSEYLNRSFPAPENGYAVKGFYKRLEGQVGNLPVVMHLHHRAGYQGVSDQPEQMIAGFYYYQKYQQPIELYQVMEESEGTAMGGGKIVLGEETRSDAGQQWTGKFLPDGQFSGTWRDQASGRELEFSLTERYPEGSVKLHQYQAGQFFDLKPADPDGPKASCDLALLYPEDYESDLGQGIIWAILPDIVNDSVTELGLHPMEALLAGIGEYGRELQTQVAEWGIDDMDHFNALSRDVQVVWNDEGRLGLRFFDYSYTGGAHGNYGSGYLNLDLTRGGEALQLTAVFKPGFEKTVTRELRLAARSQYDAPADEVMTSPFHEENLELTDNFLLTNKGILFNYVPYEVAAYAIGEVSIFVPFAKLQEVLKD